MAATGFDFADILDDAVDRAGGDQTTAADVVRVRRGMRLLLERWEAQGFNTWRIKTTTVLATGLVTTARLPDDLDDVLNVSAVQDHGSESSMRRISATEYAQLATKRSTGNPSQYWLDRKEPPVLHVYPVGPAPLVITYVARPADFDRFGNNTDDVPGRWLEALILGLALDLARKRPPYDDALINRLNMEAKEAEGLAQRADRDRIRFRYRKTSRRR